MGSNNRVSAEVMYYPQYVTVSDEKFGNRLLQYIWLQWERFASERRKHEDNDNIIPLAVD